ncbi:MAG TPA: hypothetical protein VGR40_01170 [Candidatus Binatus sp.]|nr:hypothetical protein [Candidatus Binatus sp.]
MSSKLVKLTIVALLMGGLAAVATYRLVARAQVDHKAVTVPDSPGPLF